MLCTEWQHAPALKGTRIVTASALTLEHTQPRTQLPAEQMRAGKPIAERRSALGALTDGRRTRATARS